MKIRYDYRTGVTKIKTKFSYFITAAVLLFSGAGLSLASFSTASATALPSWDLTGNWRINFALTGGDYDSNLYDLTLSQTNSTLTGQGQYPSPGPSYAYAWNVTGSVSGDTVTLTDVYSLGAVGTTMNMTGTVASDGTMTGTWDDNYNGGVRTGIWKSTLGTAKHACYATGFMKDGINLTARQIGGNVTGALNAKGCNIGVFYNAANSGNVANAEIYGSNYYGVLVDGAAANVIHSTIRNIGETPLNGAQHGVGIGYTNGATGTISGSTVKEYQKNGIAITYANTNVAVNDNIVTGQGEIAYIAQNGIQFSYGASGSARGNTIKGHWYTGPNWSSTGLLLFDVNANQVKTSQNKFINNQNNLIMITSKSYAN